MSEPQKAVVAWVHGGVKNLADVYARVLRKGYVRGAPRDRPAQRATHIRGRTQHVRAGFDPTVQVVIANKQT